MSETVQQILDLHYDRPLVRAQLKVALELLCIGSKSDICDVSPFTKLQSILTTLKYCGDYKIQCFLVKMLVREEDVTKYKPWFAYVWFKEIPLCVPTFLALKDDDEDIASFVQQYNEEQSLQFVYCIPCSFLFWNGSFLPPAKKKQIVLSINCGTKAISVNGIDKIPPELERQGLVFLKAHTIKRAQVYNVQLPFGPAIQGMSLESSVGHLLFHPYPLIDSRGWERIKEFLYFVADIDLEFIEDGNNNNLSGSSALQGRIAEKEVESIQNLQEKCDEIEETEMQIESVHNLNQNLSVSLVSSSQETTVEVARGEEKIPEIRYFQLHNNVVQDGADVSAVGHGYTTEKIPLDSNSMMQKLVPLHNVNENFPIQTDIRNVAKCTSRSSAPLICEKSLSACDTESKRAHMKRKNSSGEMGSSKITTIITGTDDGPQPIAISNTGQPSPSAFTLKGSNFKNSTRTQFSSPDELNISAQSSTSCENLVANSSPGGFESKRNGRRYSSTGHTDQVEPSVSAVVQSNQETAHQPNNVPHGFHQINQLNVVADGHPVESREQVASFGVSPVTIFYNNAVPSGDEFSSNLSHPLCMPSLETPFSSPRQEVNEDHNQMYS